ncbi:MAG: hypothetical protein MI806_06380 [Minwuiales bacterium]|nr:hypothetical protein [Minwuiales bacterium]
MGTNAVALLCVRAPYEAEESGLPIQRRGDAAIVHTGRRLFGSPIDEISLFLRERLGPLLDRHEDPRGLLIFPDVAEPRGTGYAELVGELGGDRLQPAGQTVTILSELDAECVAWAPVVGEDHIPFAYAAAAPGSVDEMIHALILKEGRMPGIARGRSLYAAFLGVPGMPPPQHLVEGRRKRLADVSDLMGEEFARELERRLRRETGQE